jgi:hypothetical protein
MRFSDLTALLKLKSWIAFEIQLLPVYSGPASRGVFLWFRRARRCVARPDQGPDPPPDHTEVSFRLRTSPLRTGRNSFADHSRELRANSPFAISVVQLRDAAVLPRKTRTGSSND